ncbi:leucine-rich repeat, immunoglobulin-like domain and transmembrane domain-containing protein 2 [Astyanax mexicanus]|uniref:leucine-rich repeat, immunoglobulin-like domain and transmembrane domain-containing protein 2 n=1 Tax=Astyanax mexicanus TaxID=7994 RepID=UPI0020CAC10B|nr:leucine-rich repeat, immunoglobulin-like domain and transmembrane domain-containing protein 2 [Astyanax mexicanus]
MDTICNVLGLGLLLLSVKQINSNDVQCLAGCSCTTSRQGRSLLCMETPLSRIPEDIPEDFTKIRIEKSHLTEIPKSAFSRYKSLENLWLNFNDITIINIKSLEGLNNLTELRLEGNKLSSVPWTAFEDAPSLKILDLKHNRLDVLPEHALKFLPGLTYLDLSFNQLTVISKDVFLKWPLYDRVFKSAERETVPTNVVLALHENPWQCDCRLRGFVEFVMSLSPPIILMNSYLSCSGPEYMAGKFFHEVELKTCIKPVATSPTTNISMPLGANVTLTCFAMARPEPAVWWTYGLKILRGFHELQTRVNEETVKSELIIPSLHLADRGVYTCTANNFIGNSSVSILVDVKSLDQSNPRSPAYPATAPEENVYIDIRIAKQTVYGITIEWYAVTENPSETWFSIHFGRYDTPKKELIYIGPGINTYSVTDLLPATKYDICVTLKNQAPRNGQCIVFVTGSDMSEMEQREKLIHIVVIVLAMVLAVPAGMYACTTDTKFHCFDRGLETWRNWRRAEQTHRPDEGQGTFDSLQGASDEGLCKDSNEGHNTRRRSEDKIQKNKPSTQLY